MSNQIAYPEGVKVRSLYKAIKLLDYFDSSHPERGISELAGLSGMLKSSIYNIMSTFETCGIIEKDPKTSQYRLGLKILELSNVLNQDDVFWQVIRPFMEELTDQTGETVFLATPYGTNIIYREAAFPKHAISARAIKGVVAPMYCTSLGKAILSCMDPSMTERVIADGLKAFTPYTITDPQTFREEIDRIRRVGYAVDNMEHEYGIKCVGVPLSNEQDQVIGAISLSGPSLRFNEQQIVEYSKLLEERAHQIRNRI
ncbi:MAG: IclR family transcriptional regulator [Oscillospiraceae bacterium]|jgi:DNA-binding IclR family transcriptional regulator|nr:IclR family transcriptional regulator [Oscillospiraceae bacterium]MCI1990911.1 IclR family transcriptional regulator [Oscillospiraceae bacterium]